MKINMNRLFNLFGILFINVVLLIALYYQFALHELPCPLCLLQRIAFVGMGVGFAMNIILGASIRHYGIICLSSLFGCFVAARQILLHIIPGQAGYGSLFLGLHFYTWAFIAFVFILGFIALVFYLFPDSIFQIRNKEAVLTQFLHMIDRSILILFVIIVISLIVLTFLQYSFGMGVDNPTQYIY